MTVGEPLAARELAAFVAAVDSGTINGAADALDLTQSAVTKRIQALERRFGVALLHRHHHGVSPTDAGRILLPDAREALAALDRAERNVSVIAAAESRVLRVAASRTVGEFLLPAWLTRFRAAMPDVEAQVEVVNSPAALDRVRDGRAEIAFVEGDDDLQGFEQLPVGLDELVVIVGPTHRWARRTRLRPDELEREPFYAREPGSGTRAVADARLAEAGVRLRPAMEIASTESLKRAVLDGGGFALLSRRAAAGELAARTLRCASVLGVDLNRTLLAVRRPERHRAATAAAFWSWLAAGR